MPDIDIDFADRTAVLEKFKHRVAKLDTGKKHNTGIYFTEIPHNPVDNISTLNYEEAENRGYFKVDFLNVSIYKDIKSEYHLQQLMNKTPMWELLQEKDFVDQLFHVNGHVEILQKLKPQSIEQLAAVLAIIRPAKRYLLNSDWKEIMLQVWTKPVDNSYYFKKSHATSYAVAVVVHMNLICEPALRRLDVHQE
jgi:DNA polymerase III alpha subunit